jgi:hypothetical protein
VFVGGNRYIYNTIFTLKSLRSFYHCIREKIRMWSRLSLTERGILDILTKSKESVKSTECKGWMYI